MVIKKQVGMVRRVIMWPATCGVELMDSVKTGPALAGTGSTGSTARSWGAARTPVATDTGCARLRD